MGILLTLFFVSIAYLTPLSVFGPSLGAFHPLVLIAGLVLLCSLVNLSGSGVSELPQTWANIAFTFSVFISLLLQGYLAGVFNGVVDIYLPHMLVFFFIFLNFKTKRHLYLLIGTLFVVMAIIIERGAAAVLAGNDQSAYVLMMRDSTGGFFTRIRGLGFINDPNDLSQVVVALIPMMFIFWKKGSSFRNFLFVYLPVGWLLTGMYMAHSRGALLAVMACAAVAFRRKIGLVPSAVGGLAVFVVLSALGWTGGRDVSAGSDRLAAWAKGIELFVTHPLFGIGLRRFTEYYEITAHNSVVVTVAEGGFVGLYFWVLFYMTTVYDAYRGAKDPEKEKKTEKDLGIPMYGRRLEPALANAGPPTVQRVAVGGWRGRQTAPVAVEPAPAAEKKPQAAMPMYMREDTPVVEEPAEIHRLCELMLISFTGFMTCGWFLSRAFEMTLYLNAGIVAVIYRIGQRQGVLPPRLKLGVAMKYAFGVTVGLIILVWLMLHLNRLTPHGG